MDKQKRNIEKKKRSNDRKKLIEKQTLKKGNEILGIGPISFDSVEYYMDNGNNFEESKAMAVK